MVRPVRRCAAEVPVANARIGAPLEQPVTDLDVAPQRGLVQRRPAVRSGGVDAVTEVEQLPDRLDAVLLAGQPERVRTTGHQSRRVAPPPGHAFRTSPASAADEQQIRLPDPVAAPTCGRQQLDGRQVAVPQGDLVRGLVAEDRVVAAGVRIDPVASSSRTRSAKPCWAAVRRCSPTISTGDGYAAPSRSRQGDRCGCPAPCSSSGPRW